MGPWGVAMWAWWQSWGRAGFGGEHVLFSGETLFLTSVCRLRELPFFFFLAWGEWPGVNDRNLLLSNLLQHTGTPVSWEPCIPAASAARTEPRERWKSLCTPISSLLCTLSIPSNFKIPVLCPKTQKPQSANTLEVCHNPATLRVLESPSRLSPTDTPSPMGKGWPEPPLLLSWSMNLQKDL